MRRHLWSLATCTCVSATRITRRIQYLQFQARFSRLDTALSSVRLQDTTGRRKLKCSFQAVHGIKELPFFRKPNIFVAETSWTIASIDKSICRMSDIMPAIDIIQLRSNAPNQRTNCLPMDRYSDFDFPEDNPAAPTIKSSGRPARYNVLACSSLRCCLPLRGDPGFPLRIDPGAYELCAAAGGQVQEADFSFLALSAAVLARKRMLSSPISRM